MNDAQHTFAFVDIVGFTAYTAARGDAAAAELAVGLRDRIRDVLPAHGAEEVKSLGDGVMIRVDDASRALELAAVLARESAQGNLPRLRVGLDTGPAVEHGGDWYGATVNRAARLCAAAHPGEVLAGPGARAAANGAGVALRRRVVLRRVRDVSPRLPVYAVAAPQAKRPARWVACLASRVLVCPKHAKERTA